MTKIVKMLGLLFLALLGATVPGMAQTTLSAGDVVIVSINGDADTDAPNNYGRGFSFMPLVDLEAGTVINFTDYGWSDVTGAFITNTGIADAFVHYTAPSSIAAGTIIRCDLYNNDNFTFDYTYAGTGTNPYLNTAGLSSSDELLVFQGTRASPVFITAVTFVTTGWATSVSTDGVASGSGSALPGSGNASVADLIDDVTALSFQRDAADNDNSSYSGITTAATKAEWQTRISNYSNWTFNDAAPIPTPLTGPFTVTGVSAAATVTTQAVSAIASTTATGNGNITSLGFPNPTAHGICWNTTGDPTVSDQKTDKGAASATGAFTAAMTNLTPNTTYYVRAFATNSSGVSYGTTVPFTTSKLTQTITFDNPGPQKFGTTPTLSATTTATGLAVSLTSGSTGVCTIANDGTLTFLSTGTCTINANQAGNATYAAAPTVSQSFTVTAVVPGAPSIASVTAGDGQATIAIIAPAFTGGSAITSYTVTSNPGSITGTGGASPITVIGLTNGVSYTFTVAATNGAGTGPASLASNAVVPQGIQTITFDNPGPQKFGTTPTLSATTTATGLAVSLTSGSINVCTMANDGTLTFLSTGTCTINANQAGNATYAAAPTVSQSFTVTTVVPGAPSIASVTAGDGQATIAIIAPAFTGGSAITSYTVTSDIGAFTVTDAVSPITMTGLTNGLPYTFTVTATNSEGTGPASAVSDTVVPKTAQTITFADLADVTYGVADFAPAVTISSNLKVTLTSDNTDVARITTDGLVHVVGAGSATITATQPGNYDCLAAEPVSKVLNVAKAPLTITALSDTITEGDAEASLQISVEGYVNMDNFSALVGLIATREPGTKAGKYKITTTATSTKYAITFVDGWFVILAAAPTSALPAMAQNASVRRVPGGLALTGLRGDLELFSLQGGHVRMIHADHDGYYAMPLHLDMYVLRSGARVWTIAPGAAR
jgi:hypothetical protein